MNKTFLGILLVGAIAAGAFFAFRNRPVGEQATDAVGYMNAEYVIDGQPVRLLNGRAETEAAPGSASKIITHYFGNEVKTDLNGDGREDVAFILTRSTGGSGTFYYAVAAVDTGHGYTGSDGYLLGDRIAPQSTNLSPNPAQKFVVVFNYADRAAGEPMSAQPSVGKSVYLKLDPATLRWGIVMPDFEGEQRACTMEVKICSDGSAVGRTGPRCEFAACPSATGGSTDTPTIQTARLGETITMFGMTAKVVSVLEDSRCPTDVHCVWAGRVRINVRATYGVVTKDVVLTLGEPYVLNGHSVTLTAVSPVPTSTSISTPGEYVFTFSIT